MDKIKQIEWETNLPDMVIKIHELIEGYNEIMERMDMHLRHHTEDAARKI